MIERTRVCKRCDHCAERETGDLECRRIPPIVVRRYPVTADPVPDHPVVPPDHWCGEWKQKEL